jgi:hypothetical protein
MTIAALERGSGIDLRNVSWTFDGKACAATLVGDELSCRVPTLESRKGVTVTVDVPDFAGNHGRVSFVVAVRSSASGFAARIEGPHGAARLKPGDLARIVIDPDGEEITSAFADVSALGGPAQLELKRAHGAFEAAFQVPSDAKGGAIRVPIVAWDGAQRASRATVECEIDATPPQILDVRVLPQSATSAMIEVRTSEATIATATSEDGAQATSGAQLQRIHVLRLVGLRESPVVVVKLTATDAAGWEAVLTVNASMTSDVQPPSAVKGLASVDLGDGSVELRWGEATDDTRLAGYRITRVVEGKETTFPLVSSTSWTGLVPVGVDVAFRVSAVDFAGNQGPAMQAKLTSARLPQLSNGSVIPPVGGPGTYAFRVTVVSPSGLAPALVARVDGVAWPMRANRTECAQGCVYEALVPVGVTTREGGPHRYSFETASTPRVLRFPGGAPSQGPTVLAGAAAPDLPAGISAGLRVPLGSVVTVLAIVTALVPFLLFARRRVP